MNCLALKIIPISIAVLSVAENVKCLFKVLIDKCFQIRIK